MFRGGIYVCKGYLSDFRIRLFALSTTEVSRLAR